MGTVGSQRICSNCGTANPAGEQFCINCGYDLSSPPPQMTYAARRMTGALASNTLLGGRYRVMRLLGKGGFGAVYQAGDERLKARVVAIKEMSDVQLSAKDRAQAIHDFRQEANMLVQLRHPNLPDVSDFFEEGGKAYLVMEFIEGETLEKIEEDAGGPLNEQQVMIWGVQLCNVLSYLHTRPQPVIFRDMKPSNVMVTKDGQIKLIDFGIARIFKSTATKDTASLGSRGYAPPEQYGRGQTDARSDIYALGATLYELLTGSTATDSVTRLVNKSSFEPPRLLNSSISPATDQIIVRAMELDPNHRFQTAVQMRDDIAASGVVPPQLFTSGPITSGPIAGGTGTQVVAPGTFSGGGTSTIQVPSSSVTPGQPIPQQPPPPQKHTRRNILIGVGAAGVLAAAAAFSIPRLLTGGGGTAATPVPASGSTTTISFAFSTEKTDWLNAAISAFNDAGKTLNGKKLQIQALPASGSVDLATQIVSGQLKPVLLSPASGVEVNQLSAQWAAANPSKPSIIPSSADLAPLSVVYSPLAFAVKSNVVTRIQQYGPVDWKSIHTLITSAQDNIYFGHTRPDTSNSGLLTIILLAYDYYKKARGLTVGNIDDQGFQKYLDDFEGAINQYGRSSNGFYSGCVLNPSLGYEIATTYENLMLLNPNKTFEIFYPSTNISSDHPFVILQGDWVTPDAQAAAKQFRDFIMQDDQQRLALTFGFRPQSQKVTLDDSISGNRFSAYAQQGLGQIQKDLATTAFFPDYNVTNDLKTRWLNTYGLKQTASC